MELIPDAKWEGAGAVNAVNGAFYIPNMPTEEIFTSPIAGKCEGTLVAVKPLSWNSQLIEDFSITFENGKAVSCRARKGQELLEKMIHMDEGASMLGEVALVPKESPVNQCGFLFYETLFDENDAFQNARSIHLCRLVKLRVHGGQCRNINDGIPAAVLPDIRQDIEEFEILGPPEEIDRLAAHRFDEYVDYAGARVQHSGHQANDDYGGNKVRNIDHHTHGLAETPVHAVMQGDRHDDRKRKAHQQVDQVQGNRIADQL